MIGWDADGNPIRHLFLFFKLSDKIWFISKFLHRNVVNQKRIYHRVVRPGRTMRLFSSLIVVCHEPIASCFNRWRKEWTWNSRWNESVVFLTFFKRSEFEIRQITAKFFIAGRFLVLSISASGVKLSRWCNWSIRDEEAWISYFDFSLKIHSFHHGFSRFFDRNFIFFSN